MENNGEESSRGGAEEGRELMEEILPVEHSSRTFVDSGFRGPDPGAPWRRTEELLTAARRELEEAPSFLGSEV